jgi:hypothetical protein
MQLNRCFVAHFADQPKQGILLTRDALFPIRLGYLQEARLLRPVPDHTGSTVRSLIVRRSIEREGNVLPFPRLQQGVGGRLRHKAASLLLRADVDGQLVLRFAPVECALLLVHRVRTTMLRAATASLLIARSRDAVSQPRVTSARSKIEEAPDFGEPLPAIVVRAQEDARARRALGRIGYRAIRAAHTQQLRVNRSNVFYGLSRDELWPTMDLVADWLSAEKRRLLARATRTFLGTMVITIVAGLGFLVGLAFFN